MNLERSNQKLKNNIIYSSLYQLLVFIVPIITTPYVTRIFDATQIGDYSLSLSIASLFVIISQFGIETYGTREIAKVEKVPEREQLFFQLISIQFTISIIMFLVYNLTFLGIMNIHSKDLFFVQSLLILVNIFDISWFFIGIEEIKRTIFRNALMKVFTTLSILLLIKNGNQLTFYAFLNVIGMLIGNLTMIIASRHFLNFKNFRYSFDKFHITGAFKLLIPRLLISSYSSIENTILRVTNTAASVGIYAQAKKIDNLIFSIINTAIDALSPRMSYYVSKNDKNNIDVIFNKGLYFSGVFSVIFVSGILVVSTDFTLFFFGEGYEMVAPVLNALSPSLILLPIIALLNRGVLIPYNREKEYSISVVIIITTGAIFSMFLSSLYGAIGAAFTYNLSQIFSLVYLLYSVKKLINIKTVLKNIIKSILMIYANVYITKVISSNVVIEAPIISFLFHGFISFSINIIMFVVMTNINKNLRKD